MAVFDAHGYSHEHPYSCCIPDIPAVLWDQSPVYIQIRPFVTLTTPVPGML